MKLAYYVVCIIRSMLPQVYVEVLNENDNTPLTLRPVYYPSVPENSVAGREVITLEAEDADLEDSPGPLTFRITAGNPESFFSIDNGESNKISEFLFWRAIT